MGFLHELENGYMLNAYSEHFTNQNNICNEFFDELIKRKPNHHILLYLQTWNSFSALSLQVILIQVSVELGCLFLSVFFYHYVSFNSSILISNKALGGSPQKTKLRNGDGLSKEKRPGIGRKRKTSVSVLIYLFRRFFLRIVHLSIFNKCNFKNT